MKKIRRAISIFIIELLCDLENIRFNGRLPKRELASFKKWVVEEKEKIAKGKSKLNKKMRKEIQDLP